MWLRLNQTAGWRIRPWPLRICDLAQRLSASTSMDSDKLGSATYLTNHTGAVTQKTLYYPWGQSWVSAGTV